MIEEEQTQFQPTEIWTPRSLHEELDKSFLKARDQMNSENTRHLLHDLRSKVKHNNGQAYAVLDGNVPGEYSTTDALVLFDSFSVGAGDNRLVQAELIRRVAHLSGVTNSEGKYKPVILLASPGPGSTIRLSKDERQGVRQGELGIAAKEMLRVVEMRDVGNVALLGFSQGAGMALAGARQAYSSNLDVSQVAVGDPTTSEERKPYKELGVDFSKATDFAVSKEATALDAQMATLNKKDMLRAIMGTLKPINWQTIVRGLAHDTFEKNLQEILSEGRAQKLVVGYGTVMAKPETVEPALRKVATKDIHEVITSIKVLGVDHTWGDELPLLAKLYMRALV